ncbi:MAG: sigma-54-dependent transcriptional regulator [Alphaproteobacteria bacterium]
MSLDILIVDDEADIRNLVAGILEDEGYKAHQAATPEAAFQSMGRRFPSLVLLDVWLGDVGMDGLGILEYIKQTTPSLPVVMMSGHGTFEMAVTAIKKGAYDFIEKPFQTDRLLLAICRALEAAKLKQENQALKLKGGDMDILQGKSQVMQSLKAAIQKIAATNSRVLITGEPGVGKELFAQEIHRQSLRATRPFFVLNCATLNPDRFEEELFGVEGNKLTPQKLGVLEQAHGGTLLLDEVTDMPLLTQGKILRVLQEQMFTRLEGSRPIQVDIRILASTRMDIPSLLSKGLFREDLYYRLNVVPLQIPSLRKRREDIPLLLDYCMETAAAAFGVPSRAFSKEALAALQTYDWPGNVRELKNTIERLLIMAPGEPGEEIRLDMLPPEMGGLAPTMVEKDRATEILGLPLKQAREVFEKQYLSAQISRFGGNVSQTADFIGMERSALHRKLRSLHVRE